MEEPSEEGDSATGRNRRPSSPQGMGRELAVIVAGALMPGTDTTIVSIGVTALMEAFGVTEAAVQWVSTAYLLALAVAIPLTGWADERFGGSRCWHAGLWLFLVGSLFCALAPTLPVLVAARAVQGFAAGMLITLMTSLPVEMARARGIVAVGSIMSTVMLPLSLGPILGPVLGGLILSVASWHWLFVINVPVLVVALVLAHRWMGLVAGRGGDRPFDAVGFVLVAVGIVALLLAFTGVSQGGAVASAEVLVPLVLGVAALAGFCALPSTRDSSRALIDIGLMHVRSVSAASAAMFCAGCVLYSAQFLLPLFWQELLGRTVLEAALLLIPQGVGALMSRSLAGRLTDRRGGRAVSFVGFVAVAVTTAPFLVFDASAPVPALEALLLVRGLAVGALIVPITSASYTGVTSAEVPRTAVIIRVFQQVGGSFGTAAAAAALAAATGVASSAALAGAFHVAFGLVVAFAVIGALAALLFPRRH